MKANASIPAIFAAALLLALPGEAGAVVFTDGSLSVVNPVFPGSSTTTIMADGKDDPNTPFITFGTIGGGSGFVRIRQSFDPSEHLGAHDLQLFFGPVEKGVGLTLKTARFFQDVSDVNDPAATGPIVLDLDVSTGGTRTVDLDPASIPPFDFNTYNGIEIRIDYENPQGDPNDFALAVFNAFGVTKVEQPADVAEPGSFALLGLGIAGLLGTRRRRPA